MDKIETRATEVEPDDDFEWVNAWAGEATPPREAASSGSARAGLPAAALLNNTNSAELEPLTAGVPGEYPFVPSAELMPSLQPAHDDVPPAVDAVAAASADDGSAEGPASVETDLPNTADETAAAALTDEAASASAATFGIRKRWGHVFRIGGRQPELPQSPAPDPQIEVPPEYVGLDLQPMQDRDEAEVAVPPNQVALAPDQLERDIAEIEIARDRLLGETRPNPRHDLVARARQDLATRGSWQVRTTEYVPILVGGALAFTLLVVFGAAASFVSLR
jgi:hypothetical protein